MTMDKTFDAAEAEPRIYAAWEAAGCFKAGAGAAEGAETFCVMIPPPNVTGSLHMGHALNGALQDVMVRRKRMQGYDVLWQPGQDHAGIATQMVVERKLAEEGNVGRRDMGRPAFVERVWRQKEESGDTIITQFKRLGASCDWSRNAFTLGRTEDDQMSRAVLQVFKRLYDDGLIYRAKRLVNWDPQFETAISDIEVEMVEVQPGRDRGKLWRFRYPLADGLTYKHPVEHDDEGRPTRWETRDHVVVATTRPETMLGDTGVAVNPDDARYAGLVGKHVMLPLVGRRIPIVADGYADPETGTGAVKMTPAHDFNDAGVAKRTGLASINVMTPRAAMWVRENPAFSDGADPAPEAFALDGLDRFDARRRVVDWFEAEGLLDGVEDYPHLVPHGDRSKVPVEPYLTDQWFVDAEKLAGPAMQAVREGRTRFAPDNWEKTYFQWLESIEPWCISRQLWWGHQVPIWYDEDGAPYCALSEAEAQSLAPGRALTRDDDVLDTWFSSALWPFSTLGWPDDAPELSRYYPTSVLSTGFDIIFFWVARMMMMGLYIKDQVPFHTVYMHALVRDELGRKMSKSVGNIIDPLTLIDQYGADAVRMTLTAMAAMGRDLRLDVSRVEGYRNFATKLWNAARFAQMNGCAVDPDFDPAAAREPVNRWIVGETARLQAAMDEALDAYRFNDAAGAAYQHVWRVYCDWYLEFAKPLLQGDDGPAKTETQKTAAWALDQILLLLHPIMPFVTEELWRGTGERACPLALARWPALAPSLADAAADADMNWTVAAIEAVRSARAEMGVAPGAETPLVVVGAEPAAAARIDRVAPLLRRLARLGAPQAAETAPKGALSVAVEGATLCLPLAGVIDVAAERARLEKARAKAQKEVAGLDKKLSNEAFLAKAPEAVVAEQRARRDEATAEIAKLDAALTRLAELD